MEKKNFCFFFFFFFGNRLFAADLIPEKNNVPSPASTTQLRDDRLNETHSRRLRANKDDGGREGGERTKREIRGRRRDYASADTRHQSPCVTSHRPVRRTRIYFNLLQGFGNVLVCDTYRIVVEVRSSRLAKIRPTPQSNSRKRGHVKNQY